MQPHFLTRAGGHFGLDHQSDRATQLELSSTRAGEEGRDRQMCPEWATKLIAVGE